MLEKIVFNEVQLMTLKKGIEKVANGYLNPKDLRKQIIELRVKLIEDLIEFFPFYLKQSLTENKLNNYTDSNESSSLSEKLQEKNNLLEEVGLRINSIYKKLKEKFEL
ncbi:MAG: hypothetical protein ACFFE5_08600 [Candidatus Thorarchaeota archaeon]